MTLKFFVPVEAEHGDVNVLLESASNAFPIKPFDKDLVEFVTDFSRAILLDKSSRAFPELVVLANFFRSANISKLKQETKQEGLNKCLARGVIFHLAPSNVDSVFLYSSLISFLCGNVNIVRISSKAGAQINLVLSKLNELLAGRYRNFSNRFFILTYEHNDAITSKISERCHMRVVWGGDTTVQKIRSLPLRPTASEICFPDRFSVAMFNCDAVLGIKQNALMDLCAKFFNDSIWFAQQACSSPRLVAWIGGKDLRVMAAKRFWDAFDLYIKGQDFENTPGMAMDRFVAKCLIATHPLYFCTREPSQSFPARVMLASESLGSIKDYHCGNGIFYEQNFESISEFFKTLTDREQTLSVFGYDAEEISLDLESLPWRTIDRIVKIGNALDFGHIWDGYNLIHSFTRKISVGC